MIRWPRAGGIEAALAAMNQEQEEVTEELRAVVHALFNGLADLEPTLPPGLQVRIAALCEIAVRARTHIPRDGYKKEIVYLPEPESNTRLAQQLAQLAKGSALLAGRVEADESDFRLVHRVAFDCMPPVRKAVLERIIAGNTGTVSGFPPATVSYAKADLEAAGLIENGALSPLAIEMLEIAELVPSSEEAA